MILNIVNKTRSKFDKNFLENIAVTVLKECNLKSKKTEIDLIFLTKDSIRKLNKKYRNIDKSTDVLSFGYLEDKNKKFIIPSNSCNLGEIFVALEVVKKNSEKYRVNFRYELVRVFVHGILHLLGYEHSGGESKRREMEKMEDRILSQLKSTASNF